MKEEINLMSVDLLTMRRQIVLRTPPSMERRLPLLDKSDCSSRGGVRKERLAEVAGGTTAECAAVCCCCPCGLVNLLVLAVYKLPAGLCRKALRKKRRRRMMKMGLLPPRKCGCDDQELQIHPMTDPAAVVNALESENKEVIELEKEMWDKFYGGGFWRSSSQRNETEPFLGKIECLGLIIEGCTLVIEGSSSKVQIGRNPGDSE
ncbi:hypothetical protein BUALT_Bualt11G0086900 [Buddleja alternifolia]|uniref:Uncharacterized protein n=1 Tax=Buddleja alternifolia TaxID=168488 RepID=A0AAV6WYC2_9LAMI|nr:hypothetical protein BUALT_Bualt11G0086900 [Buddleja alternifolia]